MSKLTDEQVEAFNKAQDNPMFHGFTCMGHDGCERSDENFNGMLTAYESGIQCPCGKYKQEYPKTLPPTFEEMDLPPMFRELIETVEEEKDENKYDPYCKVCTGCGEDGCCSALCCQMDSKGTYCESYLRDLKYGYESYREMMDVLYDKEKYPEIVKIIDTIDDKLFDKYHPKN